MEPVPPFSGIHKVADPYCESTEIFRTFRYFNGALPATPKHCEGGGTVVLTLLTPTNCLPHLREGGSILNYIVLPDHVLHVRRRRMIAVFPYGRSDFNRANFFHGLLGANVVFANEEHNVPHELEGMTQ